MKPTLKFSKIDDTYACEICHKAKQNRESFPLSSHKSVALFEFVHADVWDPYSVESHDGYKYFLTLVDDFSRVTWIFLMKSKSEVGDLLAYFCTLVKIQFKSMIKIFRSGNGTKFVNTFVNNMFRKKGILHQTSCVETPQQNGIAERKHRHLLNVARALMFQSTCPLEFWSNFILTTIFLINKTPSSVLNGKSPFEMVHGVLPNNNLFKAFAVFVLLQI